MEAYTFYYYLQHHSLPDLATSQLFLAPPPPPQSTEAAGATPVDSADADANIEAAATTDGKREGLRLTPSIYLGGVSDLTGELMRLAIASVGRSLGGAESDGESIDSLGSFVRDIKGEMAPLSVHVRYLDKKLSVLDQSLAKIEASKSPTGRSASACQVRFALKVDEPSIFCSFVQPVYSQG